VSGEDECAVAAGIYDCGREKAPNVTKAVRTALTIQTMVPGVPILNYKSFKMDIQ